MTTIRFIYKATGASGRRESSLRTVESVNRSTRWQDEMFRGRSLRDGYENDVEVGTVVVETFPVGSRRDGYQYRAGTITASGEVEYQDPTYTDRTLLSMADAVESLLAARPVAVDEDESVDSVAVDALAAILMGELNKFHADRPTAIRALRKVCARLEG